MNRKGQALIEFVLILPIFILILFATVDFGLILSKKNELENISVDVVSMIKSNKSINEISSMYPDISINEESNNGYTKVIISKEVDIMTPGLNLILGNPYKIEIERSIPNAT